VPIVQVALQKNDLEKLELIVKSVQYKTTSQSLKKTQDETLWSTQIGI